MVKLIHDSHRIPSKIIHHQVQVIISSSIIMSSPLFRGCGLQYLQSQTLLILLTLKGGVMNPTSLRRHDIPLPVRVDV